MEVLETDGAEDLLSWLQTMTSDADFQAAVEMAMGRSELETPPELWVAGDTEVTVGRPDEEKLSMITNIRMAFHAILYRDGASSR